MQSEIKLPRKRNEMVVWLPLMICLIMVVNGYVIVGMVSEIELVTAFCFFVLGILLLCEHRGWYSSTSSRVGYAIFLMGCVGGLLIFISDVLHATDQQVSEITFYMEKDVDFGRFVIARFDNASDISMLDAFRLGFEIESKPLAKDSSDRFAALRDALQSANN